MGDEPDAPALQGNRSRVRAPSWHRHPSSLGFPTRPALISWGRFCLQAALQMGLMTWAGDWQAGPAPSNAKWNPWPLAGTCSQCGAATVLCQGSTAPTEGTLPRPACWERMASRDGPPPPWSQLLTSGQQAALNHTCLPCANRQACPEPGGGTGGCVSVRQMGWIETVAWETSKDHRAASGHAGVHSPMQELGEHPWILRAPPLCCRGLSVNGWTRRRPAG